MKQHSCNVGGQFILQPETMRREREIQKLQGTEVKERCQRSSYGDCKVATVEESLCLSAPSQIDVAVIGLQIHLNITNWETRKKTWKKNMEKVYLCTCVCVCVFNCTDAWPFKVLCYLSLRVIILKNQYFSSMVKLPQSTVTGSANSNQVLTFTIRKKNVKLTSDQCSRATSTCAK